MIQFKWVYPQFMFVKTYRVLKTFKSNRWNNNQILLGHLNVNFMARFDDTGEEY